eukprot:459496-Alexandrium_andersonii.AAC.1
MATAYLRSIASASTRGARESPRARPRSCGAADSCAAWAWVGATTALRDSSRSSLAFSASASADLRPSRAC